MRRALLYVVLGWLPLAAVQGIIPFTYTLRFGHGFGIEIAEGHEPEIAQDVMNAVGMGLLMQLVAGALFVISLVSLTKSYGRGDEPTPEDLDELRAEALIFAASLLWMVPFIGRAGIAVDLVWWAMPEGAGASWEAILLVAMFTPILAVSIMMRRGLRETFGVDGFSGVAVTAIPLALILIVDATFLGDVPFRGGGGFYDAWLPPVPTQVDEPDVGTPEPPEPEEPEDVLDGRPVL